MFPIAGDTVCSDVIQRLGLMTYAKKHMSEADPRSSVLTVYVGQGGGK